MSVGAAVRAVAAILILVAAVVAFWVLRTPPVNETRPSGGAPVAAPPPAPKPTLPAFEWNSFRGPQQGVSAWDNAPVSWDGATGRGVLWKIPLSASGIGSPVLWGERLFLTEGSEAERAVLAFDARSGRALWRQVVPDGAKGQPLPSFSESGLALTTPACDAEGVYALFGTGDLAAFSHDGVMKWQVFLKRPVIGYGFSSSPVVLDNLVCVQMDEHTGGHITAVNRLTGKIEWVKERSRGASWSSPMVIRPAGKKPLLVVNANGSVTAFDASGEMVWDADGVTGEVTPSPAWWKDKLYPVHNGSGLLCYDVSGEPQKLWEYHGTLCDVASPVIAGGLLFMASGSGQMACVDAVNGVEMWTHDCPGAYASLIASGNRVYCLGRDGTTLIVTAERSYRPVATCSLGDGSDSTPALGDGRMYIRSRKYLWCLGEK